MNDHEDGIVVGTAGNRLVAVDGRLIIDLRLQLGSRSYTLITRQLTSQEVTYGQGE